MRLCRPGDTVLLKRQSICLGLCGYISKIEVVELKGDPFRQMLLDQGHQADRIAGEFIDRAVRPSFAVGRLILYTQSTADGKK